jgi:hypothetical protein
MTFPKTPEGKREALRLMQQAAPELMADIAALREQFGGTLTYFKAGGLEYGKPGPEGWQIDQCLLDRVNGPAQPTAELRERQRKEKAASARRKSKRK